MAEKQQWVYTDDGPELEKTPKLSTLKINKWYFIAPWIIWIVTIVYLFSLGGNWGAAGFLLIVFGPVPITLVNLKTLKFFALNKTKSKK